MGLIAFLGVVSLEASANEPAHQAALQLLEPGKPVKGLSLPTTIPIFHDHETGTYKAEIDGSFQARFWSIVYWSEQGRTQVIPLSKSGRFRLRIPLGGQKTSFELRAIDPTGEIIPHRLEVQFPGWAPPPPESTGLPQKRWSISPSLGLSFISFSQPGVIEFSEAAVTTKAAFQYWAFPPHWDTSFAAYYTLFPVSVSVANADSRFLGLNFRVGYRVPRVREPWRLTVSAGYYYTTMFTKTMFGYSNQGAAQLYPAIRRDFPNGQSASAYVKLAPIMSGISVLSLANREIATGATWSWPHADGRSISASVDWANLRLVHAGSTISSTSLSLSGGYTF